MKVLCCGDRDWTDSKMIGEVLDNLQPTLVIQGEAPGADTLARKEAEKRLIPVRCFPALWSLHGRGAGMIRNQKMLDDGKPDLVAVFHDNLALHDNLGKSKDTTDMIRRARKARIKVLVYSHGKE